MNRVALVALTLVLATSACGDASEPAAPAMPEITATSPSLTPPLRAPDGTEATLQYVFDGDSIEVEVDGRTEEVRLIGINAPEGDECFGDEAREALIGLLGEGDLVLVAGSDDDTDRYGRLLRYVYVDGDNINERTLTGGNAVALQSGHDYDSAFIEIGDLAASAGYGMWGADVCGPPAPAGATIAEVLSNPPGPDDEVLDREYVTIANEGQARLDLAGWTLRDESSQNRYAFGDVRLERGDHVTVRTGCGHDSGDTVFWCADRSVWSNGGDTAILQDRHGNVVDRWMYTDGS
jgi:endonuclease YncB( thermonuclease family)